MESAGDSQGTGEGSGIGEILRYVLLGLLTLIVMGVGGMLIMERLRAPGAVAARSSQTRSVEVYDHLDRSERRDYTRVSPKNARTRTSARASIAAGLTAITRKRRDESLDEIEDAIQDQPDMYASPPSPYDEFRGENWVERAGDDVMEPEIPQFLEPEDGHLIREERARRAQSPFETEVPTPNPPRPVRSRTKVYERADPAIEPMEDTSDQADAGGNTGQYHLTRQSGVMRPKQDAIPALEPEDPAGFARKQRARRGREINLAQFYEEDDDSSDE